MKTPKEWQGVLDISARYWNNYGGFSTLIKSPYLHVSIVLTIITIQYWYTQNWWQQSLNILPSILGFTLGGFAIFLGYGTEKFRSFMAYCKDGKSPYLQVVTTFVHFSVVQIIALIISILANAINAFPIMHLMQPDRPFLVSIFWVIFGFIGYGTFLYSLFLSFSTSFSLYRLASWYVRFETKIQDYTKDSE